MSKELNQPLASLSLDLDNKWAYLRSAGHDDWQQADSYLHLAIGRIVEVLGDLDLPLTVFLVGRDLEDAENVRAIQQFDEIPWEAANHSLNHQPWMHTLSDDEIERELSVTHERIVQHTSQSPVGFRGPGFSCPPTVLRLLNRMGYRYDASIFPTSLAPVARAYFLMTSQLKDEARKRASQMYGGFQSALQPNRPFMRSIPAVEPSSDDQDPASEQDRGDAGSLCEIPVSVMPITRTPIHFSYFLFLASFSKLAAKAYFRKAMMLFRMTGGPPSLLLHPPDFLGVEDDSDMAFFPGMKMPRDAKLDLMRWALGHLARQFHVVRMRQQTEQFYQQHAG